MFTLKKYSLKPHTFPSSLPLLQSRPIFNDFFIFFQVKLQKKSSIKRRLDNVTKPEAFFQKKYEVKKIFNHPTN